MGLFTLVLGALLLFQLLYIIPYIRNREVKMAEVHQEEIARSIARELDMDLLRIKNRLIRIAERPEFRDMNIAEQYSNSLRDRKSEPRLNVSRINDNIGPDVLPYKIFIEKSEWPAELVTYPAEI